MIHKLACFFMLPFLVVGLIACGDSDDDEAANPTTNPTTKAQTSSANEVDPVQREAVDFEAEEVAVREVLSAHDAAVSKHDLDGVMKYWLEKNSRNVFMVQAFGNAVQVIETWRGVKDSWEATWPLVGRLQMISTIEEVGFDARGQKATASGRYTYGNFTNNLVVAFTKDKGDWKVQAIDYGNQKLIEKIKASR